MRKLLQTICAVNLALLLLSCTADQREKLSDAFANEKKSKTIRSSEGCCEISVPGSWNVDRELNEQANLQASNRLKELYIIVISEAKEDFENINIESHSELTRSAFVKSLSTPETTGPVSVTIDNHPAVQYEISGVSNNVKIAALHTTVESNNYFHQILAWTIKSKADKNKPILQGVIQSFKETRSGERKSIPAPKPN
jgi:hypothetical protein